MPGKFPQQRIFAITFLQSRILWGISVAQTPITSNLLRYQLPSTMQLMNTMMMAPGGQSSLLIMHSAPHAITNDQTLHIIAHHLADVLRWLGSPHTPHRPSKISVMEHINYTHPATAMITISHVWMDHSYLPQTRKKNCRGRAMTLVKQDEGEGEGGLFIILQSTADVGYVICGGMDADSSAVWAMCCNCMQMDLNLCLSTSSLATS